MKISINGKYSWRDIICSPINHIEIYDKNNNIIDVGTVDDFLNDFSRDQMFYVEEYGDIYTLTMI